VDVLPPRGPTRDPQLPWHSPVLSSARATHAGPGRRPQGHAQGCKLRCVLRRLPLPASCFSLFTATKKFASSWSWAKTSKLLLLPPPKGLEPSAQRRHYNYVTWGHISPWTQLARVKNGTSLYFPIGKLFSIAHCLQWPSDTSTENSSILSSASQGFSPECLLRWQLPSRQPLSKPPHPARAEHPWVTGPAAGGSTHQPSHNSSRHRKLRTALNPLSYKQLRSGGWS